MSTQLEKHLILNELKRREQKLLKDLERNRAEQKKHKSRLYWDKKQEKKI